MLGWVGDDHQADGCLVGDGKWGRVVLFAGIFSLAVVHDAGVEEDKKEDDIAGDQDDEVQGHWVNLKLVHMGAQHDGG